MKFIDWFAGIGGFREGMEQAGHKCVGFCEFDKFAYMSYVSMHCITEEQRKYLLSLPMTERQKEIMKEKYLNGEWYSNDIRHVYPDAIPAAEMWCAGFPCQDISVAGKQLGFTGNRSSLFFRVMYLAEHCDEDKRPHIIVFENVKNLLSVNRGWDFARLLVEMDKGGYDAEWQVLNSSNFGVPQHRERVFIVGHLRGRSTAKVFPVKGTDGTDSVYGVNQIGLDGRSNRINPNQYRVYDPDGISPCLNQMGGGGREPHIIDPKYCKLEGGVRVYENCTPTLTSRDYKDPLMVTQDVGINPALTCNKNEGNRVAIPMGVIDDQGRLTKKVNPKDCAGTLRSESHGNEQKVVIPVLTPDRANKRQNGRRFKEDGEEAFTLTSQDRHGVAVGIDMHENLKNPGIYVQLSENLIVYAVWYPKKQCYVAIRKLTPKECFRLQGWSDDYFEKAQFVNSDSQLYKQAGNGVTVPVIKAIGEKLKEEDNNE